MDEDSSLTNPSFKKNKLTLYLWWALNIGIVVFVFLAFLMSTLSYAHSKDLAENFNSTVISQQGGLIENKYKVSPVWTIKKGSIASFCGRDNGELCEGLGPMWGRPFFSRESWTPAVLGSIAQLTPFVSVYLHVVDSDHLTLRASFIDTNVGNYPAVNDTATLTLKSPVSSLHARATSHPDTAVIMYTTANETFIQVITVTATGGIKFANKAYDLFHIYDPKENGTLIRNIAAAGTWTIVSYAYHGQGAKYEVFTVDPTNVDYGLTQLTGLPAWSFGLMLDNIVESLYLGNGFFLQASANNAAYGKIDFNARTIAAVAHAEYFVRFRSLSLTQLENDMVLFVGTQVEFVDQPLTVSMLVQWSNTTASLRPHVPTNLLGSNNHLIVNDQVSVCYHPPSPHEPYGGIFFSYVDALSRRAKIARARPSWTMENLHVLPSPPLDISSHQYGRYNSWLTPRLVCPVGTGPSHVLILVQDFNSAFNTFVWAGGYRFAGIAQEAGNAGANLDVIRAGISTGYERLTAGFTYYAWNNGSLAPFTSFAELFTPNGYPYPIGTAISESKLHLEIEAFDRLGTN